MTNWQTKTIRDLTSLIKDGTHGTHKEHPAGIPLLSAKDIGNGKVTFDNSPRLISEQEFNAIHKGYKLQDDDILLTIVGSLGRVAMIQNYHNNYTFQRSVAILRFNVSVLPRYMYHALTDWRFQKELLKRESKGAQGGVYLGEIAKIKLNLPEKPEQRRIVAVLEIWDEYLELLDRKIALKEQLKKGLMQQLLTGKCRLPGFSGEWQNTRVGKIAEVNPTGDNLPEEFLYIDLEVVVAGKLVRKPVLISKQHTPSRAQRLLKRGDVLFQTVRPYQRNNYYFDLSCGDYVASTGYAQLRAKSSSRFLYHFLQNDHFVKAVLKMCTGSNYPAITSGDLSRIKVYYPYPEEQDAIDSILSTLDGEIDLLSAKANSVKLQKKYLLKNLISGTIRTPENLHIKGAN